MSDIIRKQIACLVLFLSMFAPSLPKAAEINFTSESLLRAFEVETSNQTDVAVIPVYEYIQVETGPLVRQGLSFHAYGWGRSDVGDRLYFTDNDTGELLSGFLEYSNDKSTFDARLGRQQIFGGSVNEVVDGLRLRGGLGHVNLMVFAGLPVSLAEDNGTENDETFGGMLGYTFNDSYRIGLSYKMITSNDIDDNETLGIDLFFALPKGIDFFGLSSRNLLSKNWGEHLYEARFYLAGVTVRPYFQQVEYEDLFNTRSNSPYPFRYLAGTKEVLTTSGADFSFINKSRWDFGVKAKTYDFDKRGTSASYFSGLATWHKKEMSQVGLEAGIMEGDDSRDEYLLARLFCYWDEIPSNLPLHFVTTDLIYADYAKTINNKKSSLFLSLGGGARFLNDALEMKLSADYSSDPFTKEDYRSTLVVTYRYSGTNENEK